MYHYYDLLEELPSGLTRTQFGFFEKTILVRSSADFAQGPFKNVSPAISTKYLTSGFFDPNRKLKLKEGLDYTPAAVVVSTIKQGVLTDWFPTKKKSSERFSDRFNEAFSVEFPVLETGVWFDPLSRLRTPQSFWFTLETDIESVIHLALYDWFASVRLKQPIPVAFEIDRYAPTSSPITDTDVVSLPINCVLIGEQLYEGTGRTWERVAGKSGQKVMASYGGKLSGEAPSFEVKTGSRGYD